jgi:hypothetical protein
MWNLSQSESELLYDWQFTASQFVLVTSPMRLKTSNFIFHLNACGYSPYVTPSLTRGWFCRLWLLLVSPAQSFSGSSPAELMTTFYCLRFETPPTWRARSPYLYPPGTGWPGYTPRHWVPFLSPPMTRRSTVLTAAVMKSSVFFDIMPCSLLKVKQHFGGTCLLHVQGQE